ncbi:MAG: HAD-IIB family hydrolase [Gammaproteobacteria bacterium]|nr:MAG: HAD-IIB family hydrolase [Gammaproteobacteria bacterium]
MKPLSAFSADVRRDVRGVFLDIDDTLTTGGSLTAVAYAALERLAAAGILTVPITGRPAGWCDHIARMWPVEGVVGENGAFYFRYDRVQRRMHKRFLASDGERQQARARLESLKETILAEVPGSAVASDQHYRECDLAIDFCEDVERLPRSSVARIVALFERAGAAAKVSSIHVNGWFGTYDKLGMTKILMRECFDVDLDADKELYVFVGDSPNDAPMFEYFPHSVGVANVTDFEGSLGAEPAYVCDKRCGQGFVELADALLAVR